MTTETEQDQNDNKAIVVARVSSPSTNTEIALDIVDSAEHRRLVGALVGLTWKQSGGTNDEPREPRTAVLGQITSIGMRNRWHEDQTFKNIVKTRGELPAITKLQDTRTATMKVGGCFVEIGRDDYIHGDLGSVPGTGVEVKLVRDEFLNEVLKTCEGDLFYLGKDYGGNINFPMWFKHFGKGNGGVGEAYHTGIFGKTGSGKTGLAKMLIAAYAKHTQMGILVIDPQGEFSHAMEGSEVGQQDLKLNDLLTDTLLRDVKTVTLEQLQLDDLGLLEELLIQHRLFETVLGIRGSVNIETARRELMWFVHQRGLDQISNRKSATQALKHLKAKSYRVYTTESNRERLDERIDELIKSLDRDNAFARFWKAVMPMFAAGHNKTPIAKLVGSLTDSNSQFKPVIILNLAGTARHARYADSLQKRIISHIADSIIEGSAKTLGTDQTANTLVILDEAHRFAPSGIGGQQLESGDKMLRDDLRRAVRETRKYGVGWMFISQTMTGLDTELLMQLRSMFFGYGLAFGMEFQRLRDLAGGDNDAMDLYRSFRDPHSAMDDQSKQFPFMAIGPISPMPFSGQPLFFSAFNAHDFRAANKDMQDDAG